MSKREKTALELMVKALRFYADQQNSDSGEVAREALRKASQVTMPLPHVRA